METAAKAVINQLNQIPELEWGISEKHTQQVLDRNYTRAITLVQPYEYDIKAYSTTGFHDFLLGKEESIKGTLEGKLKQVESILEAQGIPYYRVENVQRDPIQVFSHKFSAVSAGLGWIGKNALLITPNHGPRVRLSTILVELELPVTGGQVYSGCGDCQLCVRVCPTKCLKGTTWQPGMSRADLVHIEGCRGYNETRPNYICALCLLVCPIGKSTGK